MGGLTVARGSARAGVQGANPASLPPENEKRQAVTDPLGQL
jgi:hypothetical protein